MNDSLIVALVIALIVGVVVMRPRGLGARRERPRSEQVAAPDVATDATPDAALDAADAAAPVGSPPNWASLARRLYAVSADMLILVAASLLVFAILPVLERAYVLRSGLVVGWLAALWLYEPLLVWRRGATLGHTFLNLCVVDNRTETNVSLPKAIARHFAKWLLGPLSYLGMLVGQRPQAIHDAWTHSSVRIKDPAKAEPHHYALDQP